MNPFEYFLDIYLNTVSMTQCFRCFPRFVFLLDQKPNPETDVESGLSYYSQTSIILYETPVFTIESIDIIDL